MSRMADNESRGTSQEETKPQVRKKLNERDLHPFLTYFAYNEMGSIYTKTIRHERGGRKKPAQWMYPDLVGVDFRIDEWNEDILKFSKVIGSVHVNLYSFEVKKELKLSNLREFFFQTVSNSSWANEGYLVAADIDEETKFLSELERLSTSFGIGVIELDLQDPDSSYIHHTPEYKEYLDWETINKLFESNPDFRNFIKRVTNDVSNDEIIREKYDKVYNKDELLKKIEKR